MRNEPKFCQSFQATGQPSLWCAWASLAQYEAVRTGTAIGLPAAALTQLDPAVSVTYDQVDQLQWMGYRGVLTDAKRSRLLAVACPRAWRLS